MNNHATIFALLIFAGWIVFAFVLARRRLNNAYKNYSEED